MSLARTDWFAYSRPTHFCDEVVRYMGDCLALVIAQSSEEAQAALKKIQVQLKPLPVLNNPDDSLQPDAPVLHDTLKNGIQTPKFALAS